MSFLNLSAPFWNKHTTHKIYLFETCSALCAFTLDPEGLGLTVGSWGRTTRGADCEIVCMWLRLLPGDSKFTTLPFFRGVDECAEDSWLMMSLSGSRFFSGASLCWNRAVTHVYLHLPSYICILIKTTLKQNKI